MPLTLKTKITYDTMRPCIKIPLFFAGIGSYEKKICSRVSCYASIEVMDIKNIL
jgi:hypothetical protein